MKCGPVNGGWQLATGNLFSVADASEAPRCVRPAHLLSPGRTRCPLAWVMGVFGHVCSLGLRATPGCNRHDRHSPTQDGHGVTVVTLVMVVCRGRNTPAQTHTLAATPAFTSAVLLLAPARHRQPAHPLGLAPQRLTHPAHGLGQQR